MSNGLLHFANEMKHELSHLIEQTHKYKRYKCLLNMHLTVLFNWENSLQKTRFNLISLCTGIVTNVITGAVLCPDLTDASPPFPPPPESSQIKYKISGLFRARACKSSLLIGLGPGRALIPAGLGRVGLDFLGPILPLQQTWTIINNNKKTDAH